MDYQVYKPHKVLEKYIKFYWILEDNDIPEVFDKQRIFPDGCIELIFHFGDKFIHHYKDGSSAIQPRSFIYGQIKQYIEIQQSGRIGILGIRFNPAGLNSFIKMDINELTGRNIEVQDIFGKESSAIEDRILNSKNHLEKINIIETFLIEKLESSRSITKYIINYSISQIISQGGNISITKLSKDLLISKRHFERQFVSVVGVNPKLFARIIRFQQIINSRETSLFKNLTDLAYHHGFYDQSHFIKEFKEFTGIAPKEFFGNNFEMGKLFAEE